MSKKKIAELIIQFGKDFFKIKPGAAGDKVVDVLKGKGGKVVTKPPKGVNPTTVTPGNVASIVRGKPNLTKNQKDAIAGRGKYKTKPDPKPKPKAKAKPPSVSTKPPSQPKAPKIGTGSNSPKGTKVTRPKTP